jgi:gamma-glutamyltranspeptidase
VTKTLAQHLLLGLPLQEAINSPHVSNLNKLSSRIEGNEKGKLLAKQLRLLGHKIELKPQTSGIHAIQASPSGFIGVADNRREGSAKGL